jgi:hypothetical protein
MKRESKRTPRAIKSYTDLSDFADTNQGAKCFVCGAGPSLAFVDLSGIHDHVVISVNSSILRMPWDKEGDISRRFWITNDTLCMRWDYFWKTVIRSHCNKIVRTSWRRHDDKLKHHGFRYFAPRETEKSPLSDADGGLCFVSSVPTAIDLALLMGCKQIYLLGVDHRMVHGNSHFWQFWPKNKWPQRSDKTRNFRPEQSHQIAKFEENLQVFESLKELAARKGSEIHNCSSRTTIDVFEFMTLEKALS